MALKVLSHTNDGTVNVLIDNEEYIYFIDPIWIDTFLRKAKRSSGNGLNFLKNKARDCRREVK